jgi:hypothetical protein
VTRSRNERQLAYLVTEESSGCAPPASPSRGRQGLDDEEAVEVAVTLLTALAGDTPG